MSCNLVVGLQWGDEGKAKAIDYLCSTYDFHYIVRYQGGANAGHTVYIKDEKFIFHLLPSGILHSKMYSVIGNGIVLDPEILINEIQNIEHKLKTSLKDRLLISKICHIIMPYHKFIDIYHEEKLQDRKIGTTKRGIGPCYSDKYARKGIRLIDLYKPGFKDLLANLLEEKNFLIQNFYKKEALNLEKIYNQYLEYAKILEPYACDTTFILNDALNKNQNLLFEGAQGTMLDIDFGVYPYVTSSNTISGSFSIGSGIPSHKVSKIYGIMKPYTTKVGEGFFPTELDGELQVKFQNYGLERGSTTGRLRRCGWLDMLLIRYAIMINGIHEIFLTKLDILDHFDEILICNAYEYKGKLFNFFNLSELGNDMHKIKPIYKSFKGWNQSIKSAQSKSDLPQKTIDFIRHLEDITEIPIPFLSIGQDREATLELR